MAIGLRPPDFFFDARMEAPQRWGMTSTAWEITGAQKIDKLREMKEEILSSLREGATNTILEVVRAET